MFLLPPWAAEWEEAAAAAQALLQDPCPGAWAKLRAGKELWELPHTALLTQGHKQYEGLEQKHLQNGDIDPARQFTASYR